MPPGALIIGCTVDKVKIASLYLLRPSGKWVEMCRVSSNEWAYKLRDEARRLLALSDEERIKAALEEAASLEDAPKLDDLMESEMKIFRALQNAAKLEQAEVNLLEGFNDEELISELRRRGLQIPVAVGISTSAPTECTAFTYVQAVEPIAPGEGIQTVMPAAGGWIRTITAVPEKASEGQQWEGAFLHAGQLVELKPGVVAVGCTVDNSRYKPLKAVSLYVLQASGAWVLITHYIGNDWASKLRDEARALLSLTHADRLAEALKKVTKGTPVVV